MHLLAESSESQTQYNTNRLMFSTPAQKEIMNTTGEKSCLECGTQKVRKRNSSLYNLLFHLSIFVCVALVHMSVVITLKEVMPLGKY
jgi:hypothetical protein